MVYVFGYLLGAVILPPIVTLVYRFIIPIRFLNLMIAGFSAVFFCRKLFLSLDIPFNMVPVVLVSLNVTTFMFIVSVNSASKESEHRKGRYLHVIELLCVVAGCALAAWRYIYR